MFNVQRSTSSIRRSTFNVQRSTSKRSTFNVIDGAVALYSGAYAQPTVQVPVS
jgi:hypothetical protein